MLDDDGFGNDGLDLYEDHSLASASTDGGLAMDDMNHDGGLAGGGELAAHHADDGRVIGEDDSGGIWQQQQTNFTCAVVSQEMVLREFGIETSEGQLMGEAMERGWLDANGTQLDDVGNLLELHGVSCHAGNGVEGMIQDLSMGHKVIVGVDADELWDNSPIYNDIQDMVAQTPNHALVVQGVKQHDDGNWSVIVNDPGDPHGAGKEYPADQFADAWQDSHCSYVATNNAPPDLADNELYGAGFDADSGIYTGLVDWIRGHSDTLFHGAQAATMGFAALTIVPPSGAEKRTDRERNDLLRDI